jgi:DNA repair exonuclease SbcCD ATPase subunit
MLYKLIKNDAKLDETTEQLVDTQAELEELENLKAQLDLDLQEYIGKNEKLDSVIIVNDAKIQEQAKKIKNLLQKEGVSMAELNRARSELNKLREQMNSLTAEIDSLSRKNQYLQDEVYIQQKQLEKKDTLLKQREEENRDLSEKVKVGERIYLNSLMATAMREALIGDFKPTDRLSKLEKIEVKFVLGNNELATKGEKTLYFKVQTPNKSTMVDPKSGSGTFSYQGGESSYTVKKSVNFQNGNEKGTVSIPRMEGMTAGEYTIIVYSETHEMGRIKFELR